MPPPNPAPAAGFFFTPKKAAGPRSSLRPAPSRVRLISRVLSPAVGSRAAIDGGSCTGLPAWAAISLPAPLPTRWGLATQRSTRPLPPGPGVSPKATGSCATLHAVGFAMPRVSPPGRCALTAPFHPCLCRSPGHRRFAFCGTFPRPRPALSGLFGRVGVTHHRVLPCSDFPQEGSCPPAAALPHLSINLRR
jgi:hypothetical protein